MHWHRKISPTRRFLLDVKILSSYQRLRNQYLQLKISISKEFNFPLLHFLSENSTKLFASFLESLMLDMDEENFVGISS